MTEFADFDAPHLRSACGKSHFFLFQCHCYVGIVRKNLAKPSDQPYAESNGSKG